MNRTVILTGSNSGLGLALAKRFIEAGDRVFGVSRTKRNWNIAHRAISNSKLFSLTQVDVTLEREVKQFIGKVIRTAGRIDVLINNAGYSNRPTQLEKLSVKEFQKNLSSNLISTFLMCKCIIPIFKKQKKGLIVNVSSMAGKRAVPRLAAYSASKFAVVALSQSIAKENQEAGFKCLSVCPGGMNTKLRKKLFGAEDAQKQQSPEFVADVIMKVVQEKIHVESGGDIVIRHGKITAINPCPCA